MRIPAWVELSRKLVCEILNAGTVAWCPRCGFSPKMLESLGRAAGLEETRGVEAARRQKIARAIFILLVWSAKREVGGSEACNKLRAVLMKTTA